jgi:hypothetical protein
MVSGIDFALCRFGMGAAFERVFVLTQDAKRTD